jgi:hypothetical protein
VHVPHASSWRAHGAVRGTKHAPSPLPGQGAPSLVHVGGHVGATDLLSGAAGECFEVRPGWRAGAGMGGG